MRATLKKKEDFTRVFRFGRVVNDDGIVFRYVPNNISYTRFAFVVSKAVAPRAVVRNKIRRRLRGVAREYKDVLKKSVDGIFIARKNIQKVNTSVLKERVRAIFKQISHTQQ